MNSDILQSASIFFKNLPDRVDWDIISNVSLDFLDIHIGNMFESSGETVVFADEGVKDFSKVEVGIFITSIHTAMLVIEVYCTCNGLSQSETRCLGDNSREFIPSFFGDMLCDQGVLGLDVWEFCHFDN